MEWAVGKNGDEMRPDSGRLMLPNSKIVWEMHYHAVGEEITAHTELAVWFYPKGQEPKHREVLALFNTFSGAAPGGRSLDIPPNSVTTTESFVTLKQNARIENFQAHMHLRGKGMSMEAIYPGRQARDAEPGDRLQLQLAQHVHLRRRCGAAAAEGHDPPPARVVRQHEGQQVEPRSGSVGRLGRSHRRRDGPRVAEHHLLQRRRVQGGDGGARGEDGQHDGRAIASSSTIAEFVNASRRRPDSGGAFFSVSRSHGDARSSIRQCRVVAVVRGRRDARAARSSRASARRRARCR